MTSPTQPLAAWSDLEIQACGRTIRIRRAGSGPAMFAIPRDTGHPPRHEVLDRLAATNTVYQPWLPGYAGCGEPADWEWLATVRDLAVVLRQALEALEIERATLVGFGFGGWLAAEMAAMGTRGLDALVLVNPMGIKPEHGFIYDQFIGNTESYVRAGFEEQSNFDALYGAEPAFEQLDAWETDRSMTSRVGWKPYMFNPALPGLLAGVKSPALVVSGDADRVVPPDCAEQYQRALPNASIDVIAGGGHAVDLEQPERVAAAVTAFLARARKP